MDLNYNYGITNKCTFLLVQSCILVFFLLLSCYILWRIAITRDFKIKFH